MIFFQIFLFQNISNQIDIFFVVGFYLFCPSSKTKQKKKEKQNNHKLVFKIFTSPLPLSRSPALFLYNV